MYLRTVCTCTYVCTCTCIDTWYIIHMYIFKFVIHQCVSCVGVGVGVGVNVFHMCICIYMCVFAYISVVCQLTADDISPSMQLLMAALLQNI